MHHFSVLWKISLLYFFSSNNIYFAQKEPIKVKSFETFECSGQNLSNSSYQFWNDKSIPPQILYHSSLSWHISPLWILSSYFLSFGLKDPIKMTSFKTFNSSGENLPYSSCHFPITTSQFFFKFCITLQCRKDNSSVLF